MWWNRKVKYEDLKLKLDQEVFQFLERIGFQKDQEDLVYKKETSFGYEIFELTHLPLSKELKIGFGLRFNEIETIYDIIHKIKSPENSYTLFIDAENLLHFKEAKKAKFKFNNIEDVKLGFENAMFIFDNYSKEYFRKYNSLSKLSQLVNREKNEFDLRGNFKFHGSNEDAAIIGIIASKILVENDTEELKRKHLSLIPCENLKATFNQIDKYFEKKN